MANTNSSTTHPTTPHASATDAAHSSATTSLDENRWLSRFEDLLKVKNVDELKTELSKLAAEIQTEIQNFDINSHLSPEAKNRLKALEVRYAKVIKAVQKAQKQFDREFNKSLRVLKRTRQDAEKHLSNIKIHITKHRGTIVKASKTLKQRFNSTAKKAKTTASRVAKKAVKKATVKSKTTRTHN